VLTLTIFFLGMLSDIDDLNCFVINK